MTFLRRWAEPSYTLLRAATGLMFMFHGAQKMFGFLEGYRPPVGTQIWLGGIIELVCGALVAVGLLTRIAAFLASGTMAVAYVQFHWKLQLGADFFPAVNKGELAVVYALLFLYVACAGGGRYALDALLRRPAPGAASSERQALSA
jgi:putative oxidoreductase